MRKKESSDIIWFFFSRILLEFWHKLLREVSPLRFPSECEIPFPRSSQNAGRNFRLLSRRRAWCPTGYLTSSHPAALFLLLFRLSLLQIIRTRGRFVVDTFLFLICASLIILHLDSLMPSIYLGRSSTRYRMFAQSWWIKLFAGHQSLLYTSVGADRSLLKFLQ